MFDAVTNMQLPDVVARETHLGLGRAVEWKRQ